jgi:cyclophilin family peptidyl-prolyl cis-trans isomerase
LRHFLHATLIVLIAFGIQAQTKTKTTTTTKKTTKTTKKTTSTKEKKMANGDKVAVLHTDDGDITIRFFPDVAPNHVKNFLSLAEKGFYNGTKFHRIIPGFMIQGGDPNTKTDNTSSWGTGGSGTNVNAEFNKISHKRGIVSMARSNSPNSASSQFFIVVKDSTFLDNQYTVFGQVTKGMDVADKIVSAPRGENDRPNKPVAIKSITVRAATAEEKGPRPQ